MNSALRHVFLSALALAVITPPANAAPIFEGFETIAGTPTYNGVNVTCESGPWFIAAANGTTSTDRKGTSIRSIRMRGSSSDTNLFDGARCNLIEMRFDKQDGIGNVNFKYASYSTHSGGIVKVQYSTNGGTTWTDAPNGSFTAPAWDGAVGMLSASVPLNIGGAARIRVYKGIQTGNTSVNIDDIELTDPVTGPTIVAPADGTITNLYAGESVSFTASATNSLGPVQCGCATSLAGATWANQTLSYTASISDFGTNLVHFTASDSAGTSTSTVRIVVLNRAPVITLTPSTTAVTLQAGETAAYAVSATDADGEAVALGCSYSGLTAAAWASPNFSYTAVAGDAGTHTVTFTASDGKATTSAGVTITVVSAQSSTPNALDATDVTATSFTANWTAFNGATGYNVMVGGPRFDSMSSFTEQAAFTNFTETSAESGLAWSFELARPTVEADYSPLDGIKLLRTGKRARAILDNPVRNCTAIEFDAYQSGMETVYDNCKLQIQFVDPETMTSNKIDEIEMKYGDGIVHCSYNAAKLNGMTADKDYIIRFESLGRNNSIVIANVRIDGEIGQPAAAGATSMPVKGVVASSSYSYKLNAATGDTTTGYSNTISVNTPAGTTVANSRPEIAVEPIIDAYNGRTLTFKMSATDDDVADSLTITANSGTISGFTFELAAGEAIEGKATAYYTFTWTPSAIETNIVVFLADDGSGAINAKNAAGVKICATIGAPENIKATATYENGFFLTWDEVPGATAYEIDVSRLVGTTNLVFHETFANVTNTNNKQLNDADCLVGSEYTDNAGWTGTNVYSGVVTQSGGMNMLPGAIRLGQRSDLGWVASPDIDLSAGNGEYTIEYEMARWDGSGEKSVVTTTIGSTVYTNSLSTEIRKFSFAGTDGTAASKFTFSAVNKTSNRFFLGNVRVYEGRITTDLAVSLTDLPADSCEGYRVRGDGVMIPKTMYSVKVRAVAGSVTSADGECTVRTFPSCTIIIIN